MRDQTLQQILSHANPNTLADALRAVDLGLAHSVIKVTFAGLTSAAAQNITTPAAKAAATIVGIDALPTGVNLPAIGEIVTLRVTAGAAAAAHRNVTDAGGTASTSLALLSDDGKTLTFEAAVTGFVITYRPRSATALTSAFGSLP